MKYNGMLQSAIEYNWQHQLRTVIVVIFITFSVKFPMLTFVVVNFSVMFTHFGHIDSDILIWSIE